VLFYASASWVSPYIRHSGSIHRSTTPYSRFLHDGAIDDGRQGLRIVAVLAAFLETYRHQNSLREYGVISVHSLGAGPCQDDEGEDDIRILFFPRKMYNCEQHKQITSFANTGAPGRNAWQGFLGENI
jgi:hypothetical protein